MQNRNLAVIVWHNNDHYFNKFWFGKDCYNRLNGVCGSLVAEVSIFLQPCLKCCPIVVGNTNLYAKGPKLSHLQRSVLNSTGDS